MYHKCDFGNNVTLPIPTETQSRRASDLDARNFRVGNVACTHETRTRDTKRAHEKRMRTYG